jgi:hypothetical protein
MFKLGSLNNGRGREMTFKQWRENAKAGHFPIEYIFLPKRYPSISLIFRVDDQTRVRMTLPQEKGLDILKAFGFKKQDIDFEVFFYLTEEGEYGIDKMGGKMYYRKWGWSIYPEKQQEEEEPDIEL